MPKSPARSSLDGHAHLPALYSAPDTAVLDSPAVTPAAPETSIRRKRSRANQNHNIPQTFHAHAHDDHHGSNHQAELFYLQKQIQQQTQMIFVMEDGARVQGVIEWYDRHSIKVRGKSRVLIFKSAIKYLHKAGELGSAPGE